MAQPRVETFIADDLVAGSFPISTQNETVAAGQSLVRGQLVGRVKATGEVKAAVATATDGSQVPIGLMVYPVDTTGGAAPGEVYIAGTFRLECMVADASFTPAALRAAFDNTPITLV